MAGQGMMGVPGSPSGMPWPGMMTPGGMQEMDFRLQPGMQGDWSERGVPAGMPGGMWGRRDMQSDRGTPGGYTDFGRGRGSDFGRM